MIKQSGHKIVQLEKVNVKSILPKNINTNTTPIFEVGDELYLKESPSHTIKIATVYELSEDEQYGEGLFEYRDASPMNLLHSEKWLTDNYNKR